MHASRSSSVLAALLAAALAAGPAAGRSDPPPAGQGPDLSRPLAAIQAKQYDAALRELSLMLSGGIENADIHNLIGYALRKNGDKAGAATYYAKALALDPDHKGALEYQGELFVETGDLAKAKLNLARLVTLCPTGCEERADLEAAITAAEKK